MQILYQVIRLESFLPWVVPIRLPIIINYKTKNHHFASCLFVPGRSLKDWNHQTEVIVTSERSLIKG
ncbi:MAG: hypothetical protein ACFFDN_37015 [Candidatus Hodarchaeota archaeon]